MDRYEECPERFSAIPTVDSTDIQMRYSYSALCYPCLQ